MATEPILTVDNLFKATENNGTYFEQRPTSIGNLDEFGVVGLDALARITQDVGQNHSLISNFSDFHPVWIVRNAYTRIEEPIKNSNFISCKRYCVKVGVHSCVMRVEIRGDQGGLAVVDSVWVPVGKTGVEALNSGLVKFLNETTANNYLNYQIAKFDYTDFEVLNSEDFPLRFTDIDILRHVNNAVYVGMIVNLFPKIAFTEFLVEYVASIPKEMKSVQVSEVKVIDKNNFDKYFLIHAGDKIFAKCGGKVRN